MTQERYMELQGEGRGDMQRILAYMVFPGDELFRQSYLKMLIDQGEIDSGNEGAGLPWWELPRWAEMKASAETAARKGVVAGYYLAVYEGVHRLGVDEPSSRKARQALEKFLAGRFFGDDARMKQSDSKVRNAVKACQDVAHLWAANTVLIWKHGAAAKEFSRTGEAATDLLRLARHYQEWGLVSEPSRRNWKEKNPVLPAHTLWRVPNDVCPVAEKQLPELHAEIASFIANYAAT